MLIEFLKSIFYYRRIDFRGKLLIFLWQSLFTACKRRFALFFQTQSIFINTHYLRKQHRVLASILISRTQYLLLTHHTTPHHTTSHHITSHLSTSHHITSHHITSHHRTPHHTTAHHIKTHHYTQHHITPHYTTSHHTTPLHITPQDITSNYIIPHYTTSHHTTPLNITPHHTQHNLAKHFNTSKKQTLGSRDVGSSIFIRNCLWAFHISLSMFTGR